MTEGFKRWLAPRLPKSDAVLGVLGGVVLAFGVWLLIVGLWVLVGYSR